MIHERLSRRAFLIKSTRVVAGTLISLDGMDRLIANGGIDKCFTPPPGAGKTWASGFCEQKSRFATYELNRRDLLSKLTDGLFKWDIRHITRDWTPNRIIGLIEATTGIGIGFNPAVELVNRYIDSRSNQG